MKDYKEQAELYVSGLNSGNIVPGSDQFINVLTFLKSFRKHLGVDSASGPLYRSLVDLTRQRLYGEIVRPLSGRFRLISKGEAHLMAGLLKQGDRTWFVKTVSSSAADELDTVKALLNGLIPRSGQNYSFLVPESVILNAGLVTYVSPAIAQPNSAGAGRQPAAERRPDDRAWPRRDERVARLLSALRLPPASALPGEQPAKDRAVALHRLPHRSRRSLPGRGLQSLRADPGTLARSGA